MDIRKNRDYYKKKCEDLKKENEEIRKNLIIYEDIAEELVVTGHDVKKKYEETKEENEEIKQNNNFQYNNASLDPFAVLCDVDGSTIINEDSHKMQGLGGAVPDENFEHLYDSMRDVCHIF